MAKHIVRLLTLVMIVFCAQEVSGQEVTRHIRDSVGCRGCTIVLDTVGNIGPQPDSIVINRMPAPYVAVDSQRRVFLAPASEEIPIAVFRMTGELLTTCGRHSHDSHGFSNAPMQFAFGPKDTVHVFQQTEHTVLGPGGGRVLERTALDLSPRWASLLGDTLIVSQAITMPRRRVVLFHAVDGTGTAKRSFGDLSIPDGESAAFRNRNVTAANPDGTVFWSAPANRYEVHAFSRDGAHLLELIRESEWFRPYGEYLPEEPFTLRPRPKVSALSLYGERDTLLVAVTVSDREWVPNMAGIALGGPVTNALDLNRLYDTVLELLDTRNGEVIARTRVDEHLAPIGRGIFSSSYELSNGRFGLFLWQPRFLERTIGGEL